MGIAESRAIVPSPSYVSPFAARRLSHLSDAAPRLRKELDAVMALQAQIDNVATAMTTADATLSKANRAQVRTVRTQLEGLRRTHGELRTQAEALYASLNVGDNFPEIADFGFDFVKTLVMAYDAKCAARSKVTGRFFEWERLDQAVGGAGTPLGVHPHRPHSPPANIPPGTTQHQRTVRSIRKRTPALQNSIQRYNDLCDQLYELLPEGREFPLPQKLPVELAALRDNPALLEDVWLSDIPNGDAPWLLDSSVRRAIRSQLILDRCGEERARVALETQQLFTWVSARARAIDAAIANDTSA